MVRDQPVEARRAASEGLELWRRQSWDQIAAAHLATNSYADLYEGRPADARARTEAALPQIRQAMQLRLRSVRLRSYWSIGRGALDEALRAPATGAGRHRAALRRCIDVVERQHPWSRALASMLRAGSAMLDRNSAAAARELRLAEAILSDLDMEIWAAVVRRRRGELGATASDLRLVEQADAFMASRGVAHPERLSELMAPRLNPGR
jgi:hypothetical protein